VIRSYELGLTQFLIDQGFVPAALACIYDRRLRLGSGNPSIRAPMTLLKLGVPYIKVALLRDNPEHLRLRPIRARMASLGCPVDLLELDYHPQDRIFYGLHNRWQLLHERWGMRHSPFTLPIKRSVSAESKAIAAGETGPTPSSGLATSVQGQSAELPLNRPRRPGGSTP